MESKPLGANQTNREYEIFEPSTEWAREDKFDTLIVHLPGFIKEQLKVQVTSSKKLRIRGECPLSNSKWSSFRKELLIPSNYDANQISAKFEGDKLFIKHPKIITPADHQREEKPQEKAVTETPKPQKPESDYTEAHQKSVQDQQAATATQQVINPPSAAGINGHDEKKAHVRHHPKGTGAEKKSSRTAKNNGEEKAASVEAKTAATQQSERLADEVKSTLGATATIEKDKKVVDDDTAATQQSERLADEVKSSLGATATIEKDKKVVDDDAAASAGAAKEAAGSSNERANKYRTEDLKQALGGLAMELKQPRKFLNFTVAVLLVLVAYIYAKNAIGYIGKSKN